MLKYEMQWIDILDVQFFLLDVGRSTSIYVRYARQGRPNYHSVFIRRLSSTRVFLPHHTIHYCPSPILSPSLPARTLYKTLPLPLHVRRYHSIRHFHLSMDLWHGALRASLSILSHRALPLSLPVSQPVSQCLLVSSPPRRRCYVSVISYLTEPCINAVGK